MEILHAGCLVIYQPRGGISPGMFADASGAMCTRREDPANGYWHSRCPPIFWPPQRVVSLYRTTLATVSSVSETHLEDRAGCLYWGARDVTTHVAVLNCICRGGWSPVNL